MFRKSPTSASMRRVMVRFVLLCSIIGLPACESTESWLRRTVAAKTHLTGRSEAPHRLAVLSTGREALLYRIERIRGARRSIRIQTFIFADCKTTRLVLHELIRAARRGVDVRILADSMFSEGSVVYSARAAAAHELVQFRAFNPVTESLDPAFVKSLLTAVTDLGRINHRMHNKVMVIDERFGICGGRNFHDAYFDEDFSYVYRDRDVAVEGPVVAEMVRSFDEYWNHESSVPIEHFKDVKSLLATLPASERNWPFSLADLEITELAARMETLLGQGEPRLGWHDVHAIAFWADGVGKPDVEEDSGSVVLRLIGALGSARHRLLVQTPYLVLTDATIEFFGMLDDEVAFTVHSNSLASTDNWQSYAHATRQRLEVIKKLGIDVRESKPYPRHIRTIVPGYPALRARARAGVPGKAQPTSTSSSTEKSTDPYLSLHAKSLVVDDELAVIGSYNLDPRSENLNSEVLLAVWDKDVAALLAKQIELDCGPHNSWVVAPKERPLGWAVTLGLLERVNAIVKNTITFDLWPIRSCALFDIKPGAKAVSRFEGTFYESYVDVGQFPGVSSTTDQILVRLTRALTGVFRGQM